MTGKQQYHTDFKRYVATLEHDPVLVAMWDAVNRATSEEEFRSYFAAVEEEFDRRLKAFPSIHEWKQQQQQQQAENWSDLIEQVGVFAAAHPKASIGVIAEEFALSYDDAAEAIQEYGMRQTSTNVP